MRLSEAIKHGSTLRPESHQERFIEVENRGLCSDVWGAAVEAVWPKVAKLNWNVRDRFKFETTMNTFRSVQQHYFGPYFRMPAQCPGSVQRFERAGGRIINRRGDIKIDVGHAKQFNAGGVTSECERVNQLAGLVDHMFYAHGWTREQCAEAVAWYEQKRAGVELFRNFAHYQMN